MGSSTRLYTSPPDKVTAVLCIFAARQSVLFFMRKALFTLLAFSSFLLTSFLTVISLCARAHVGLCCNSTVTSFLILLCANDMHFIQCNVFLLHFLE
jgi:hypothetical protein